MNPLQKRAIPLYTALLLIVLATTLLVTRYGSQALSATANTPPSQEMIDLVLKEAEGYIRMQRYNHASGVLRRLLADAPNNFQAQLLMSICYYALDQLDLAERSCKRMLAKHPDNIRLLNNLGEISVRKGDLQTGLRYLKKAAKLAPDMPVVQQNLSLALSAAGNFELARKYQNYARFLLQCGAVNSQPYMISNAQPQPPKVKK